MAALRTFLMSRQAGAHRGASRRSTPTYAIGSSARRRLCSFFELLESRALLTAGALDSSFGDAGIATAGFAGGDARGYALAVQSDGKIVEAGTFTVGTADSIAVARFNDDGSLDTSFGTGGEVTTSISVPVVGTVQVFCTSLVTQDDGKIIVAGNADGGQYFVLARYDTDGTPDSTFGTNGIVETQIGNCSQIMLQPDGKIVAVGGNQKFVVARYNTDGSLDTTFGNGGSSVVDIGPAGGKFAFADAIQTDGKIIAAGFAPDPNAGETGVALARFNADGSLDTTFGEAGTVITPLRTGWDEAYSVTVQTDGKILAAGTSERVANDYAYDGAMVRYNSDGSLDTNFGTSGKDVMTIGSGTSTILQASVLSDGKIVTSGTANGQFAITRLNADGSLDTTFNGTGLATTAVGTGFQAGTALAVDGDGNYLQAGVAEFGGHGDFVVVRYEGGSSAVISPVQLSAGTAISATEGVAVSQAAVATFTDPNGDLAASQYQATIDWGDGGNTPNAIVSGPDANSVFTVLGSHTYADATSHVPITVSVTRPGAGAVSVQASSDVADAPLSGSAPPVSVTAGTTFSGTVATFTDANPASKNIDFSASIDWGDGTTTAVAGSQITAANGRFSVPGSHLYAHNGAYTLSVVVADTDGSSATVTSAVTVSASTLVGTASPIAITEDTAFTGTVASFSDPDAAGDGGGFSATIDWGDGQSSAGAISDSAGSYSVAGSHIYAATGTYTVTTTIMDGATATVVTGDAVIAPQGTPHERYVETVYHDVLGRPADSSGLAHWAQLLDGGMAISGVAEAIAHSDEYYTNFVIKPDYVKLLGRAADSDGVSHWTSLMRTGMTDQQLEADLVASNEFYDQAGGTPTAWIDAVYKLLLGRTADADGEHYWDSQLAGGATRNQLAQRIAGSQENNSQLINNDYFHYLGRAADSNGLNYWLGQFSAGETNEDVVAGFTGAIEYYKKSIE